jgi:hypothetical protein
MMHEIKPIDHEAIREKISMIDSYWERQPTDQPWTVNGFNGTWNFSDHSLIPDVLRNFISESFPKIERFKRIPLEDINTLMNDVWEGPGSMVKIQKLTKELRSSRLAGLDSSSIKMDDVKTINDFTEEAFLGNKFDDVREERE